jgi:hypothetical protein
MVVTGETYEAGEAGVVLLTLGEWDHDADMDGFVDRVSRLVQDRDDVRCIKVLASGGAPHSLRYLVDALNQQAQIFGKTVDLTRPLSAG